MSTSMATLKRHTSFFFLKKILYITNFMGLLSRMANKMFRIWMSKIDQILYDCSVIAK